MAYDELNLKDVLEIITRQARFILSFVLVFIVAIWIVLLLWPKSYLSESIIQLATAGSFVTGNKVLDNLIFTPVAAKALLESTIVLQPAFELYSNHSQISFDEFKEKHLSVEIYKERIGREEETANFIIVRVDAENPKLAHDMNNMITMQFLNYTIPFYNRTIKVIQDDYSNTNKLIEEIQSSIKSTEAKISSSSGSDNSASDSLLLTRTLLDYRAQLFQLYDRRTRIEGSLSDYRRFKVVSEPSYPEKYSSPKSGILLIAGLIAGILIAFSVAFAREER